MPLGSSVSSWRVRSSPLCTAAGSLVICGPISSAVPESDSAYDAELCGELLAAKFCYGILNINNAFCGHPPYVVFGFDNVSDGRQVAGDWRAHKRKQFAHAMRGVAG